MAKQLQITPQIRARLEAVLGSDYDLNNVSVYEAVAVDNQPITQKYSLYDGSIVGKTMMLEAAEQLNSNNFVPLQIMHDTNFLPVGRLFSGRVRTEVLESGAESHQLRVLFYIPKDTDEGRELIKKIDAGVILDVSVGMMPRKAECSTCGWDYMGEEASFMNFFEQTCGNGHQIGEDGTHLKLEGCADFSELSLVNNGASPGAQIVDSKKSTYQNELSPVGFSSQVSKNPLFFARFSKGESAMFLTSKDIDSLVAKLRKKVEGKENIPEAFELAIAKFSEGEITVEKAAEITVEAEQALTEEPTPVVEEPKEDQLKADEEVTPEPPPQAAEEPLTASAIPLETHLDALVELRLAKDQIQKLQKQVEDLQKKSEDSVDLKAAKEFLQQKCKTVFALTGAKSSEVPESIPALIETINRNSVALAAVIPVGGVSNTPKQEQVELPKSVAAFSTFRKTSKED